MLRLTWFLICCHILLLYIGLFITNGVSSEDASECGDPPKIPFAEVLKDYDKFYQYNYIEYDTNDTKSATVEYKCVPGATQSAEGPLRMTCKDGKWSPETHFSCEAPKEKNCTQPPLKVGNAMVDYKFTPITNFLSGSHVFYECNVGMVLKAGSLRIQCNDGQWQKPDFKCEMQYCRSFNDPKHGRRLDNNNSPGQHTIFSCNPGYIMKGTRELLCRTDWEWVPRSPPTCEPVKCRPIYELLNGYVFQDTLDGMRDDFKSIVEYNCNRGYRLKGPSTRRCNENGQWEGEDPVCYKPMCPLIEKPFYNGEIFYLDNRAVHGVALFLCTKGEADLLPGFPKEMYCLDNEEWALTENKIPSCYGLASVPEVRNGDMYHVTRFHRTLLKVGHKVQHKQKVILECRSGWEAVRVVLSNIQTYLGVESDRTSRNNNGTWEPPIPECGPARCHLKDSRNTYDIRYPNGTSVDDIIYHDDSVSVSCANKLYEFQSREPSVDKTCSYGVIDFSPCLPKSCKAPDSTIYPRLIFFHHSSKNDWFGHDVTATAICANADEYEIYDNKTGRFADRYQSRCFFGSWTFMYGCVEKHCDLAASEEMQYKDSSSHRYISARRDIISGESVLFSCAEGYDMMDNGNRNQLKTVMNTCNKGAWSKNLTCKPKRCKAPDSTNYPHLIFSPPSSKNDWFDHDVTATANCANADEYEIYDNKTGRFAHSYQSRCSFGSWTFMYGCVEKHCDLAASEEMQYKDSSSHRYMSAGRDIISGESVLFSCVEGYDMTDNGNRNQLKTVKNTCNKGAWSKHLTCKPKRCKAPDSTNYPHLIFSPPSSKNDWFDHDVTVTVTCTNEDEYEIQDVNKTDEFKPSYTSTCSYGSWSHEYRCVEKRCALRNERDTVYNRSQKYLESGEKETVSCRMGYELFDENTRTYLDIDQRDISCTKGKLSAAITCIMKRCVPAKDNNTIYHLDETFVDGGTFINVSCKPSFELYDQKKDKFLNENVTAISCTLGHFTPNITCGPERCKVPSETTMHLLRVNNNKNITANRNVRSGKDVRIVCIGRQEQSNQRYTCLNGAWTPMIPTCNTSHSPSTTSLTTVSQTGISSTETSGSKNIISTENQDRCEVPSSADMNVWHVDGNSYTNITHFKTINSGKMVNITCKNNNDSTRITYTCENGAWEPTTPACTKPESSSKTLPTTTVPQTSTKNSETDDIAHTTRVTAVKTDNSEQKPDLVSPTERPILVSEQNSIVSTTQKQTDDELGPKGCVLPAGYTINDDESGGYMINDDESGKNNSMVSIVDVGEFAIKCGYEEINVTCDANGKIEEDLNGCDFAAKKCPKLHHLAVTIYDKDTYILRCDDGYSLSISDCSFTGCADQKFKCGSPTCEPANCLLKAREGLLSNNEFKEKGAIELVHNSSVIVGCDEGKEPAAVMYSCSFGKISGNNTKYPTESGNFLPQCKTASCNRCINGTCIRDNKCRCDEGYEGHYCDQVICPCAEFGGKCPVPNVCECPAGMTGSKCDTHICDPLCLENNWKCNSQGHCICPIGWKGDTCQILDLNEYRIDVQIAGGWFDGTYERVWIKVIGVSGAFKQELVNDLDRFSTFSRNEKLRYKFNERYVGEIKNVYIRHNYGVDKLSIKNITIHSFKDETFYRFDSETFSSGHRLTRRMCTFTTHPRRVMRDPKAPYRLGITEDASECQLRCMGENECALAVLDKRRSGNPTCLGYLLGSKVFDREVENTNMYERKDCIVSIF